MTRGHAFRIPFRIRGARPESDPKHLQHEFKTIATSISEIYIDPTSSKPYQNTLVIETYSTADAEPSSLQSARPLRAPHLWICSRASGGLLNFYVVVS